MKVLNENMEAVTLMMRDCVSDGRGGLQTKGWKDGIGFFAVIVPESSREAVSADKRQTQNRYTVIAQWGALLRYHDIIRRERDGKIFRITSDAIETTSKSSFLALEKATAEEWSLT